MILNGKKLENGKILDYDICIVGSGPAGLSVALELEPTRKRICVLEAGDRDESKKEKKEFYKGENAGLPYDIAGSRSRRLGGTSDRWAGYCALLDPEDFEKKSWIPNSGWPISYQNLLPFYKRAHRFLGLDPFEFNPRKWVTKDSGLLEFDSDEVRNKIWNFNNLNFADAFEKRLKESSNIDVYLNSGLNEIHLNKKSDSVGFLKVRTSTKKAFKVRAKGFVLACGGLENARILLAQNQRSEKMFTNENIGRWFQEHPHYYKCANMLFYHRNADTVLYYTGVLHEGKKNLARAFFQINSKIRNQKKWQNLCFRFNTRSELAEQSQIILKILKRLYHTENRSYRMPRVLIMSEQYPNPLSRVTLSEQRDRYHMPRIKLDWKMTELEMDSIYKSTLFLARKLGENGLGRLKVSDWLPSREKMEKHINYGCHHLGTTRMSESPKSGVVDRNCRIFGLDNFFIAGSSVFPTGGCANPTLTILALSIRLADHLKNSFMKKEQ